LMHLLIRNAWSQKPYAIDTLFMYMANMGWNSSMNTAKTVQMLTDIDPDTGEYKIPHIIYVDAFASETVAYADLILPDTTYLERFDCISLLDRPISTAEGPADAIRQPVLTPDRDVRPFQDVLIDLGARLQLPEFVNDDGSARYTDYPDYIMNRQSAPGVGSLAGWRGRQGDEHGRGEPNQDQIKAYIANQCHWEHTLPESWQFFKHANRDYLEYAQQMGWLANSDRIVMQLYCETLQRFRLSAMGHGTVKAPAHYRERLKHFFDPLPFWYAPLEEQQTSAHEFPLHAITQRPMAMYHSWGSQNAWLRQIHGWNRLYIHADVAAEHDLADDDWAWLESHNGRIHAQIRTMSGCNRNTVWTWNAIGKRQGAWNLSADAEESQKGMLLNDLINDLLPDGRFGNADPITGQAAWFDLRVRISKAEAPGTGLQDTHAAGGVTLPGLEPRPDMLRFGEQFLPDADFRKRSRS
ncbi:MAG: molybdopterin-dependent oxidoreductase, partial [Gammaproteobacteria bacterium]|nr:molybdopterin-dependent oxidoreductase [Gammaproteobacteria bacterium]